MAFPVFILIINLSATAAGFATILTHPFDVVKTRQQILVPAMRSSNLARAGESSPLDQYSRLFTSLVKIYQVQFRCLCLGMLTWHLGLF